MSRSQGQGLRPGAGVKQTPELRPSGREGTEGGRPPENVPGEERSSEAAGRRGTEDRVSGRPAGPDRE